MYIRNRGVVPVAIVCLSNKGVFLGNLSKTLHADNLHNLHIQLSMQISHNVGHEKQLSKLLSITLV